MHDSIVDFTLTASAAGTASQTTDYEYFGEVVRVELKAATLKTSATVKGYETSAYGAVGSRNDFLAAVGAGSALAKNVLPQVLATDITGANLSGWYQHPVVAGKLTLALAGANEGEIVYGRVYIR
jgi:hypothetical protein